MPMYTVLNKMNISTKKRVANNLLQLKNFIDEGSETIPTPSEKKDSHYSKPIPPRTLDDTLLLASWNIREMDSPSFGKRSDEAMLYIAEIISKFDLVAIQEIKRDVAVLDRLTYFLGKNWDYLVTDETMGDAGNRERLAFVYDTRKIRFTGLAGEIQLPEEAKTFARSPFMAGFQAGWFKFALCTVHMIYGEDEKNNPERINEIAMIAQHLVKRRNDYKALIEKEKMKRSEFENVILLGDFNIYKIEDETYKALHDAGFDVSNNLITNAGKQKRAFDQIAYISDSKNIEGTGNSGVLNYYEIVYKESDIKTYKSEMQKYTLLDPKKTPFINRSQSKQKTYYKTYWRTHMMSDHLPIWTELKINFSSEYLERKAFEVKS